LVAVGLAGCLALYVDGDPLDANRFLTKSAAYLLSFGIYLGATRLDRRHLVLGVTAAVGVYGFHGLLQVADQTLFVRWSALLVPVRDVEIGERGIASLTPEATDLGLTMVFVALLAWALAVT